MKKAISQAACFAAICLLSVFSAYAETASDNVGFTWALSLVSANPPESFVRPVRMKTGENFSFKIQPDSDAWCYIVAETADKQVLKLFSGRLPAGKIFTTGTWQLSPPSGTETFYIIMSSTEQAAIGKATSLEPVFDLRREISKLKSEPEKPVRMGGVFRGENDDQSTIAVQYSGADTYVKTVFLRH